MKLEEWLETHDITKRKVSKILGRGQQAVFLFLKEKRVHALRDALALEKLTEGKVSLREMLTDEEMKHVQETPTYSELKKPRSFEERKPRSYVRKHPKFFKDSK